MHDQRSIKYLFDLPGCYQIRVWGTIEERWFFQSKDLEISVIQPKNQPPVTKITGWLADQCALAGLLDLLNDLGLVILTVRRLDTSGVGAIFHSSCTDF